MATFAAATTLADAEKADAEKVEGWSVKDTIEADIETETEAETEAVAEAETEAKTEADTEADTEAAAARPRRPRVGDLLAADAKDAAGAPRVVSYGRVDIARLRARVAALPEDAWSVAAQRADNVALYRQARARALYPSHTRDVEFLTVERQAISGS